MNYPYKSYIDCNHKVIVFVFKNGWHFEKTHERAIEISHKLAFYLLDKKKVAWFVGEENESWTAFNFKKEFK